MYLLCRWKQQICISILFKNKSFSNQCLLQKEKSKEINSKYKLLQIYHKRAFRYCIPYLYDILSSFTSCYKRDFNIIITFNTEYFQLYQLVKHLKELLIEDILRHFPTLCNRSDAEHNLLLFNVSLDRRKFWSLEIKTYFWSML